MKQVVQNFRTGELKVDELPPPALRPGGVLVRTAYSLISPGTERMIVETAQSSLIGKAISRPDLARQVIDTFKKEGLAATYHKVKSRMSQMKALGYSASGEVTAVGSGAGELQVGDRVACAGAGYASHAEVIFVPRNLCCKVPDAVPLQAACYTTVGAIALQGIRQAEPALGEAVVVIGLGLVGQLTVQLLKAAGCRVLGIDIDSSACELAGRSGADAVAADPASARAACAKLTDGNGADCIIIAASAKSSQPVELAADLARDRARVVVVGLVGMDVPRQSFYEKELELRLSRSYGPGRYDPEYEEKGIDYPIGYVRWTERRNMEAFLRLVAEGKVDTDLLTTQKVDVSRATEAYDLLLNERKRCCGVVLEYAGDVERASARIQTFSGTAIPRDNLGISFIGAGNFARGVLLPIVKNSAKVSLVGVAAATGLSAKSTAGQFGFSHATTDYQEILNNETTDVVFIVTRHDSHSTLAAEALRRGKHVFVEKPLATSEGALRDVAAAARESDGLLMVGYNRRFAPIAGEVKHKLRDRTGPLTMLYRVNAGQLPRDHWAHDDTEGAGRVIGEICHFIDFVQYMTGALPNRVSAQGVSGTMPAGLVDDSIVVALSMTDGSIASIVYAASGDPSVPKERIEIFCDGSIATIDDFKTGLLISGGKKEKFGGGKQDKGHATELSAFLDAARGHGEAPISLESLVGTTVATFAILEAARSGTSVPIDINAMLR